MPSAREDDVRRSGCLCGKEIMDGIKGGSIDNILGQKMWMCAIRFAIARCDMTL